MINYRCMICNDEFKKPYEIDKSERVEIIHSQTICKGCYDKIKNDVEYKIISQMIDDDGEYHYGMDGWCYDSESDKNGEGYLVENDDDEIDDYYEIPVDFDEIKKPYLDSLDKDEIEKGIIETYNDRLISNLSKLYTSDRKKDFNIESFKKPFTYQTCRSGDCLGRLKEVRESINGNDDEVIITTICEKCGKWNNQVWRLDRVFIPDSDR